jgi:hypothetical protein
MRRNPRAMLTLLSRLMKQTRGRFWVTRASADTDETAPIFESLVMTEELREALFPTQPRMVSAIFDRPSPMTRPAYVPPPARTPATGERPFPILF